MLGLCVMNGYVIYCHTAPLCSSGENLKPAANFLTDTKVLEYALLLFYHYLLNKRLKPFLWPFHVFYDEFD